MPTVANLAVSVTARTGDFNRKMQESASLVRDFGRDVVNISKKLVTFGTIAGGVVFGGLSVATRQAFKLIGATGTLADRLGITTEELTGLRHALVQTGSNAKVADRGLSEFVRRLGEASSRSGAARDAVRQLGLDEQKLVAMGAADAIKTFADRVALLPNRFQQAEATFRLLGTQGREWVKILSMGSRGINEFIRDAQNLGVTFTRLEAQQIRNANNALKRLGQVMRTTGLEIAKRLAPFVHWAAQELVQFATAGGGAGVTVTKAFGVIAEAGAKLASALAFIESAWHGLNAVVLTATSSMLVGFEQLLRGLRVMLAELASGMRAIATLLPIPRKQLDAMDEALDFFNRGVTRSLTAISGMADTLAVDAAQAIEKMNEAWEKFASGEAAEDFRAWFKEIEERSRKIAENILKLKELGPKIPLIPLEDLRAGKAAKTAEFQQIALSRVAVQGVNTPGRAQIVRDPQLEITNEHLHQMRTLMSLTRALTS